MMMLFIPVIFLTLILFCTARTSHHRRGRVPKIPHKGLEMMAYKGRIVYVRETTSERDLY